MSEINVDSLYIKSLLVNLDNSIVNIHQTILFINNSYRDLGTGWKDSKYQELGQIVDKCTEKLGKLRNELYYSFHKLYSLYEIICEYEKIDLISSESYTPRTSRGQVARVATNARLLISTGFRCIQTMRGVSVSPPLTGDEVRNSVINANNRVRDIDLRAFQEERESLLWDLGYIDSPDSSPQRNDSYESERTIVVTTNQFNQPTVNESEE